MDSQERRNARGAKPWPGTPRDLTTAKSNDAPERHKSAVWGLSGANFCVRSAGVRMELDRYAHWKTAKELAEQASDREVREAIREAEGSA